MTTEGIGFRFKSLTLEPRVALRRLKKSAFVNRHFEHMKLTIQYLKSVKMKACESVTVFCCLLRLESKTTMFSFVTSFIWFPTFFQ